MLSDATIEKLRQIIKKDYGIELDDKAASEAAYNLVRFFDLLAKIYYRNQPAPNDDGKPAN